MNFIKKQSAGFYLSGITTVLAAAGLVFYLVNCNTDYFSNLGVNAGIVCCLILAIVLEAAYLAGYNKKGASVILDLLPVICGALFMVAFVLFVGARVNSIATIMSFEKNAQTMADLSSAIIGLVLCLLAVLFHIAGSFFKVVKEEN